MTPKEKAQHEFIDLFVIDVEDFPHHYKREIVAQPHLHAMRIVAGLDEADVRKLTAGLKKERGNGMSRTTGAYETKKRETT